MKLLFDANISWRISEKLKLHFDDCLHVDYIGLNIPAKDIDIWNFAKQNDLIIITNDDDFLNFSNIKGFPPKVVLLKTGNQSNQFIHELILKHKTDIAELNNTNDYGLIEIY